MDQTITTLPGQWLTTQETAKALGKHERTVQKMAKAGLLKWKLVERPGTSSGRLYNAEDVRRYLPQSPKPEPQKPHRKQIADVQPSGTGVARRRPRDLEAMRQEVLELGLKFVENYVDKVTAKPWISIDEASEETGLTSGYIKRAIMAKKLKAVRGGEHGTWRIRRASLEAFAG